LDLKRTKDVVFCSSVPGTLLEGPKLKGKKRNSKKSKKLILEPIQLVANPARMLEWPWNV
jgi:hypothetical protein